MGVGKWEELSLTLRKARILADTGGVNNPFILGAINLALQLCDHVVDTAIGFQAEALAREEEDRYTLGLPF